MKQRFLFYRLTAAALVLICFLSLCGCHYTITVTVDPEAAADPSQSGPEIIASFDYENALSELMPYSEDHLGGIRYTRMQQYYQGLPVYGRSIVYVTDPDGNELAVSADVADIDPTLSVDFTLEHDDAFDAAEAALCALLGEGDIIFSVGSRCIYNLGDKDRLAYCISSTFFSDAEYYYDVLVDAHTGEILLINPLVAEETTVGYKASDTERENGFPVEKEAFDGGPELYYMTDSKRGIYVRTFGGFESTTTDLTGIKINHWAGLGSDRSTPIVSSDDIFGNGGEAALQYETGADLMQLVSRIQDEVRSSLGFHTHTGKTVLYVDDGYSNGMNARGGLDPNMNGLISVGSVTGASDIDTICHEYGHLISHPTVYWLQSDLETCALDEAFSDVFAELMEAKLTGAAEPDWTLDNDLINVHRSQKDPAKTGNYASIRDLGSNPKEDGHLASTIVSHAFYLMWNGMDGDADKRLSIDELLSLWYRTLLMLPSSADFAACRTVTELAARTCKLTDKQLACVGEAFDAVGIAGSGAEADHLTARTFTLNVLGKDGAPYGNYTYHISGMKAKTAPQAVAEFFEQTVSVFDAEPQEITLDPGHYTVKIMNNVGAKDPITFTVRVQETGNEDDITIITNYAAEEVSDGRNALYLKALEEISETYGYGSGTHTDDYFRGNLIDADGDGEDELLLSWFDDQLWAINFGLWDIRNGEAACVYSDTLAYEAGGGPLSSLTLCPSGLVHYRLYGETFTSTDEWSLLTVTPDGAELSSVARMTTDVMMDDTVAWDDAERVITYYLNDSIISRDEYLALDFVGAEDGHELLTSADTESGLLLAFAGTDYDHEKDGSLDFDALAALLGKEAGTTESDTPETTADTPSADPSTLCDRFFREKPYMNEWNGENMSEYCLFDLDQDGTDEIVLQGTTYASLYMVFVYDKASDTFKLAGSGESMFGIDYSPATKAIVAIWRDLNNGNPIYMYTISRLVGLEMDASASFVYDSGRDCYKDHDGRSLSEADCGKYLNDTITFEFTPLEDN